MAKLFENKVFQDATAAREWLEKMLWPNGPICGHCGVENEARALSSRPGTYQCNACRKQFTVTVGTVFERSHIPLNKWLLATFLFVSSKKGISAHQVHRLLDVTYKSAWFMMHRLREAMAPGGPLGTLGGEGKFVEADATYIGGKEKNKHVGKRDPKKIGGTGKMVVHTLVERDGRARSRHVPNVRGETLAPILFGEIDPKSALMTDTAGGYMHAGKRFARHEMVDHGRDEYVRGDAHSNTVEGYFSILKRGIIGTYHHVSEAHLQRYLHEFDFRHSNRAKLGVNDELRAERAIKGIVGKRLTYRQTNKAANA
jgi:transposase-like protein